MCGIQSGAATAKGIEDDVTGMSGDVDDAFKKSARFLGGIAEPFLGKIYQRFDVSPPIINWSAFFPICQSAGSATVGESFACHIMFSVWTVLGVEDCVFPACIT